MVNEQKLRNEVFSYLGTYGEKIKTKLTNMCSKTGQYSVPDELFQKRTKRSNRSLITWKTVKDNNLTIEQLDTFEGGVVVEFVNNDFFAAENHSNEIFKELCRRIGSNENVSAIISIRSEGGNSSSQAQRDAFKKLVSDCEVSYNGATIKLNENNYSQYALKQDIRGKGQGNETWSGFLYVSIRGGQQDTIETHRGQELTLFNPACDYASSAVCNDIDLVMSYFAMKAIDVTKLSIEQNNKHQMLMQKLSETLKGKNYNSKAYSGNLYDYCHKHFSVSMIDGQLTDPIQLIKMDISSFDDSTRNGDSIDFTHSEAVIKNKFYWDDEKKAILSPSRPTNVFWSYHLSNMMQQDYDLEEYFKYEEERFNKRKELINK